MSNFSPSTWVLSNSTIKSALSGISNFVQTPNGFKITTNDGRTFEYVVQNMHEHQNLTDVLEKLTTNVNGELFFDSKKILTTEDITPQDIEKLQEILDAIELDTDGKMIINDVKITTDGTDIFLNGETVVFTKDEMDEDIDFDNDIIF